MRQFSLQHQICTAISTNLYNKYIRELENLFTASVSPLDHLSRVGTPIHRLTASRSRPNGIFAFFAHGVVNLSRPWCSTSSDYFSIRKMKIKTFGFCGDYECRPFIILFSAELILNGPPFYLGRAVFDLEL